MKEIIFVSPKLGIGGIQRALTNLANWMAENGTHVIFISCKKEAIFYDLNSSVDVIMPQFENPKNWLLKPFHYLRLVFFLRNNFRHFEGSNVLAFGEAFNPLSIIASIGIANKVYISDRAMPNYDFGLHVKILRTLTYNFSAGLISQTTLAKDYSRDYFGSRLNIEVVPNPVRKIALEDGVERQNEILFVGRLSKEKNPLGLIRAFKTSGLKKDWKLVMVGDGPLHEQALALVEQLNISDSVQFTGQIRNVDHFYSRAKIFVLPSYTEGFPNSLCEAMSAGIACICSSSIPYNDVGKRSVDFEIFIDEDDLSSKLRLLALDSELRANLGQEGGRIKERLDINIIGKKFIKFLS